MSKIDKARITENNGKKWYRSPSLKNDEADQYGKNVSIEQGMTKRRTGIRGKESLHRKRKPSGKANQRPKHRSKEA